MDHGITQSESLDEFAISFAVAQYEFPPIPKAHTGKIKGTSAKGDYEYEYAYADLADTLKLVVPVLKTHGLSVMQFPGSVDGDYVLTTIVMHESGQWIKGTMRLPVAKVAAQALGSAITYCRRYALSAVLGIATEPDDDGAHAQESAGKPAFITEAQRYEIGDAAKRAGLSANEAKNLVLVSSGARSSAEIPADRFADVLAAFAALEVLA
jgi:hypothetical protein